MRLLFINLFDVLSNFKWDLKLLYKLVFQKEFRKTIQLNKKFKNLHFGERCFVVGNGPSLKKLDLTKLENEIVFTVNNIMSNLDLYKTLNSDYHVLIDPNYLKLNPNVPEDMESIYLLKQINYENKKPICIVREDAKKPFKKLRIDKQLDLYYIFQHRNITNNYSSRISMCWNMPSSQNVTQAAIFSAMYMGFSKIYLIGIDMTSVFLTYEANEDGKPAILKDSHAHGFSEKEVKTILTRDKLDNEFMLYDYAKTFTIFKRIRKYAERKGISIINATKGGGLDVFERMPFDSLF